MRTLLATVLAACLLAGPVADAQAQSSREEAEEALKEGAEQLLRALRALIASIPIYAAPELLENGDILIRRRHPERNDPAAPPATEETRT